MSDRTVAIEGWDQFEWLMSDRWDMTLQEALQCMVQYVAKHLNRLTMIII